MIKILIVDDDTTRTRDLYSVIENENVHIDIATTERDALKHMSSTQYDLALLDILLPNDQKTIIPNKDAGLDLLNQIQQVKGIKKPHNIVGITSGIEAYESALPAFDSQLLPLLFIDAVEPTWKSKIRSKIEYLLKIDSQKTTIPTIDYAIITAVDVEFEAAHNLFDNWESLCVENDPMIYETATLTIDESSKRILLAKLPEMGMTSASCITTKIIKTFSPSQIYMVGICGGVKGEVELEDLVVSSISWDYGSGKIKPRDENDNEAYYQLDASPNQISINASIQAQAQAYAPSFLSEISAEWNKRHIDKPISPKFHIAPMPSGASVVCDEVLFSQIIKPQHRKCVALDMETYGVYFAIKNSTAKNIDFFSAKCVSDFADKEKNDGHHKVCCYISANFVKKFIIKHNSH